MKDYDYTVHFVRRNVIFSFYYCGLTNEVTASCNSQKKRHCKEKAGERESYWLTGTFVHLAPTVRQYRLPEGQVARDGCRRGESGVATSHPSVHWTVDLTHCKVAAAPLSFIPLHHKTLSSAQRVQVAGAQFKHNPFLWYRVIVVLCRTEGSWTDPFPPVRLALTHHRGSTV